MKNRRIYVIIKKMASASIALMMILSSMNVVFAATQTLSKEQLFETKLETYAKAIVTEYVNIQKGDVVIITAPPEACDMAARLSELSYQRGAKATYILYDDLNADNINRHYLTQEALKDYRFPGQTAQVALSSEKHVLIALATPKFQYSDLVTEEETLNYQKAMYEYLETLGGNEQRTAWNIAYYPTKDWAHKVYPELSADKALDSMWADIFEFVGIDDKTPEKSNYMQSTLRFEKIQNKLNEMGIVSLNYKSKTSDLTVGLHQNNVFAAAKSEYMGRTYYPNVPSEEIFAMPNKTEVNGWVEATKPFKCNGVYVEGMKLKFEKGKVVEFSATKNEAVLRAFLEQDEGHKYLGEAAIVAPNSTVASKERLYYNTIIDENAACHIAFGYAFNEFNLKKGAEPDENVNTAAKHVDFMIGSDDIVVTATLKDGSKVEIIKDGEWSAVFK